MPLVLSGSTGIVEANIADNAITANKIVSDAITSAKIATGAVSATDLASGAARTNFGAGAILQVIQTVKQDAWSYTGSAWTTVSGLTASITPSSTSSKILVKISLQAGQNTNAYTAAKLQRNGSDIAGAISTIGGNPVNASWSPTITMAGSSGAEYDTFSTSFEYLDSPSSTSSTIYSVVISPMRSDNAKTITVNYGYNTSDNNRRNGVSTITLMEIAG